MPSERRLITFSRKEVEAAIRRFAGIQGRAIPKGEPSAIEYRQIDEEGVSVKFSFENGTQQASFTDLETAAALIGYCSKLKVPIPRHGRKSVRVVSGELTLRIEITPR